MNVFPNDSLFVLFFFLNKKKQTTKVWNLAPKELKIATRYKNILDILQQTVRMFYQIMVNNCFSF